MSDGHDSIRAQGIREKLRRSSSSHAVLALNTMGAGRQVLPLLKIHLNHGNVYVGFESLCSLPIPLVLNVDGSESASSYPGAEYTRVRELSVRSCSNYRDDPLVLCLQPLTHYILLGARYLLTVRKIIDQS